MKGAMNGEKQNVDMLGTDPFTFSSPLVSGFGAVSAIKKVSLVSPKKAIQF